MASMAPSPTSHGFLWATAGRMGQGQQLGHAGGAGGGKWGGVGGAPFPPPLPPEALQQGWA